MKKLIVGFILLGSLQCFAQVPTLIWNSGALYFSTLGGCAFGECPTAVFSTTSCTSSPISINLKLYSGVYSGNPNCYLGCPESNWKIILDTNLSITPNMPISDGCQIYVNLGKITIYDGYIKSVVSGNFNVNQVNTYNWQNYSKADTISNVMIPYFTAPTVTEIPTYNLPKTTTFYYYDMQGNPLINEPESGLYIVQEVTDGQSKSKKVFKLN